MTGQSKYTFLQWRSLTSFMLLAALLLLGFCPLRNTLLKLAEPSPVKTGQPIPEYGKISSGTECITFHKTALLPVTERLVHGPSDLLTFAITRSSISVPDCGVVTIVVLNAPLLQRCAVVPIYLRNRTLLI